MKRLVIICLIAILFPLAAPTVKAVSDPPQFSCVSPIGVTIAAYSEGTHGIPGDAGTYTGSDTVYRVDSDHVLQCFCPDNGNNGIQSNWWKVSEASESDINYYEKRGWVYIPNGLLWGLEDSSYFVKNASYSCSSDNGTGGTGGNNNGGGSSSSNTSNSSGGSSSSDNGVGGAIGSVLGASALAATGTARSIVLFTLVGLVFAWAAFRLRRE